MNGEPPNDGLPKPKPKPARARRTERAAESRARPLSHDDIHEKIYRAILEHRLRPGAKLGEERLAQIFSASRARVREVLARLAHEQVVELVPQHGAYVARPTIEQTMHVFEARRLIEPALVQRLVGSLTPDKVARLRAHTDLEIEAHQREDRRAVVRLSGEFHTLLAALAGNTALERCMRQLSMLTCLAIVLYDAPTAASCRADEHTRIVEAIAGRDAARGRKLMLEHLDHIEVGSSRVDLQACKLEYSIVSPK